MASATLGCQLTVDNHPLICELLDSFHSVKMGNASLGSKRLFDLANRLSSIEGLDPITNARIQYVASEIFSGMNLKSSPQENLISALTSFVNIKNALQVESMFFGGLAPMIFKYSELLKIPYLKELVETLPDIFSNIHYDIHTCFAEKSNYCEVDATPFTSYIESLGIDNMPDDFDSLFFVLLSGFEWKNERIIIRFDQLPSRRFLETIIQEKGVYAKLIAQILYLLVLDKEMMVENMTTQSMSHEIIQLISTDIFRNYLDKKPLIPFFHFLLERQALAKSQGISWQVFYLRKEFLEDFTAILSRNWLKEASSVYHFVRKIEIGTRKFVDRPIISRMDSLFMEKGCDFYVLKFSETLSQLRVSHKIALPYPISKDKPFCVTREEFEVLAYTEYQRFIGYEAPGSQKSQTTDVKPNPEKAVVLPKKAKKRQARRDAFPLAALPPEEELVSAAVLADSQEGHCSKEGADHEEGLVAKPKDRSSDAVGGGAAALFPDSEGHLLEEGASFVASSDSFLCKLGRSLEKSASLLQSITIHPRVEAWYFSKEAGLEYYHFHSEPSTHHLSEAEMVRSHRFPEIFLSLIFNKNYSKEEKILRDNGTIHTHYRSVVIVDERKYILEATISEVGVLYHFYLKPIKKLIHYFEMTKDSIAEFPPISSLSASKSKALNTFDSSGVTFHRDGHLLTKYEGSNYKVLYLGQGKDPDLVS